MTYFKRLCLGTLLTFVAGWGPLSDQLSAQDSSPKKSTIKLDGVLESPRAVELRANTEQFKNLVIDRVVPHGKQIKKGDKVVWFKTDELDKQIQDAKAELALAELALKDAKFKHQQVRESQKLDRMAAERAWKQAQADHQFYQRVDRDYQRRSAEMSLKDSQSNLENVEEEYNQLEKMYRADDLTEESEEIVLKRTRWMVEMARFRFEAAKQRYERTMNETLERNEAEQAERFRKAEMAWDAAQRDAESNTKRREIELRKQNAKFEDQKKKFEQLVSERQRMVLKAPRPGIVIHGNLDRGNLTPRSAQIESGKSVKPDEAVVTITPLQPNQVRLAVAEKDLRHLKVGDEVMVIANSHPDTPLPGTIRTLSSIPYLPGKFDCTVRFNPGQLKGQLIMATGCKVEITTDLPVVETPNAEPKPAAAESDANQSKKDDEAKEGNDSADSAAAIDSQKEKSTTDESKKVTREDPITGTWDVFVTAMGQEVAQFEMDLKMDGDGNVSGSINAQGESIAMSNSTYDYDAKILTTTVDTPVGETRLEFKLLGREMTAEFEAEGVTILLKAVRR